MVGALRITRSAPRTTRFDLQCYRGPGGFLYDQVGVTGAREDGIRFEEVWRSAVTGEDVGRAVILTRQKVTSDDPATQDAGAVPRVAVRYAQLRGMEVNVETLRTAATDEAVNVAVDFWRTLLERKGASVSVGPALRP